VVAATLGISAVLQASPTAYDVLRYVGAAYLAYIGLQALSSRVWGRRVMAHEDPLATPRRHGPLLGSGFVAGLATDLLNPKVGVFFVTFLPAFVPAGSHVAPTTLAFGAVFVLETFAYFVVLIKAADRILDWMARPRTKRILDRAAGVVFIGFGLRLATEGS
jgi:threonine/homoserine/homoserine lactone efflux protein